MQYKTNIEKVASLNHKIFDNSMKRCIFESGWYAISFKFSGAKLSKILCCFWHNIGKKLDDDSTNFLLKEMTVK